MAVHHVEDALQSKNFTFKCHRDGNDIYSVNSIAFHPQCVAPIQSYVARPVPVCEVKLALSV